MFALFRNRNFLFLWLGQLCSQFGDRLTQVILIALVAARASGSTLSLAKVLVITSLPALLLNPFAGAYVDRWDRKQTMILCDLIRAVVIASFPWLAASPSVAPLYCGIFLVFAVAAFFIPARLAIIPDLVSENQLPEANALFTSSGMIGSTFTILIGAFLVEWIGTTRSCWINGASYGASALFILPIIRRTRAARASEASPRILFQEVAEGLRELWRHSDTRRIILLLAVLMGGAGASIVVGTVLIQQSLGSVTKDVGILSLWAGVGMVLGAVTYGRWGTRTSRRQVVAFSFLGAGLSLWFFLWMVIGFRSGVGASAATTLLGFCLAPVGVVANTFVHEGHVERLHGRIFSSLGIVVNLAFITASLIAGWLAERSHRGVILGAVGFLYAVGGVILLCYTKKEEEIFSMSEVTVTVTESNFKTEVLQSKTPVLVDFWATWCGPCRAVAPVLDELAGKFQGKFTVGKVNVDDHPNLAAQFGILNIPTMIFFKAGQEVDRIVGVQSKGQLETKIQKLTGA